MTAAFFAWQDELSDVFLKIASGEYEYEDCYLESMNIFVYDSYNIVN